MPYFNYFLRPPSCIWSEAVGGNSLWPSTGRATEPDLQNGAPSCIWPEAVGGNSLWPYTARATEPDLQK